jgi:pyruvate dehydrogenase E2 component (dihydrolipoamide acetyltransferase)
MEEGKLAKWLKKEGDTVKPGDVIAEIETDKATMEVEAVDEGTIGKIVVDAGTEGVKVNAVIAILLEEGESKDAINDNVATTAKEKNTVIPAPEQVSSEKPSGSPIQSGMTNAGTSGDRVFASPLAKRIAADKGVNLSAVKGSGPHGRIVKADVENAKAGGGAAMPKGPSTGARKLADQLGMEYELLPNSSIRKVIANRLLESKQTIPHFYLSVECQIDSLLSTRKQINDMSNGKFKISVNDFVIKAVANALHAYPAANVAWTDEAILQFKHADVAVAVATDNGLITPIIKKAEGKSLVDISNEIKELAGRAREGKLKPEEFQGGTFSISNLGMFGVQTFSAIINPPQSCILAVGAGAEKPYVDNGQVKIGNFMTCTLSVDHRSVDGAVGAEYLQHFKNYIENPASLLL